MKDFMKYVAATIAAIILLNLMGFLTFFIFVGAAAKSDSPDVEKNSIIVAKFDKPVSDRADDNPFNKFTSLSFSLDDAMGLDQILKDIKKAESDENISGIFLRLSSVPISMASLEEIRDALKEFKESGKFIIAHSDTYSHKSYYLATVADKIYLTPTGDLTFTGLSAQVNYYKNALDKVGVDMQVIRHGSYKAAVEPYLTDKMSDENREQISGFIGTFWDHMMAEISEARGISVEDLNTYADELSVTFDHEALEKGMVDGLVYYDEILDELRELTETEEDDDIPAITLAKYKDVPASKKAESSRDKIAIIYAMGSVVTGDAGEGSIGSDRIAKAIREAREDEHVKAIVFRVNSGGGSALASEVIYREVMLATAEKPVVASLGDVAASGGYYIVCPADTIVASETTITGSIGVFGLLPNIQGLLKDKIGVNTEAVSTNAHSDMGGIYRPLSAEERAFIQSYVDDTYTTFVTHVSEGRNMSFDAVDAIGGGRVWSGRDAMEIGLVDVFGGLETAVNIAVEMAGLESYRITTLPKLEDPVTTFLKMTGKVKARIIQKELGASYEVYQHVKELSELEGIQAIMPYSIDIY